MVVVSTLPYLSACDGLLQGSKLLFARHQIRLIIGCLKALGDVWKKGASRTRELKAIGKEILCGANPPAHGLRDMTAASCGPDSASQSYNTSEPLLNMDMFPTTTGERESAEFWPVINPQLDISAWITNNFGTEALQS